MTDGDEGSEKEEDEEGDAPGDADEGKAGEDKKRTKTCNDCNRQFCLDYNLPKCKALPAEDVTTACFRKLSCGVFLRAMGCWRAYIRGEWPRRASTEPIGLTMTWQR